MKLRSAGTAVGFTAFAVLLFCHHPVPGNPSTGNMAAVVALMAILWITEATPLAARAVSREVHPLLFMVPATISASMAFMMPVATPPNAVVFGSQRIRIAEMARIGIVLNFAAMAFTLATVSLLFGVVFGSSPGEFPDWAK